MSEIRNLIFLVQGSESRTHWSYTLLDSRDVYDRDGSPRTGEDGQLRDAMESMARRWFERLHPGVMAVSEGWREVPASDEEWKELIDV